MLALFFTAYFGQLTLEAMVTPVMANLFHFGEFENSMFFAIAGGFVLVVCISVGCLSKRFGHRDR